MLHHDAETANMLISHCKFIQLCSRKQLSNPPQRTQNRKNSKFTYNQRYFSNIACKLNANASIVLQRESDAFTNHNTLMRFIQYKAQLIRVKKQ